MWGGYVRAIVSMRLTLLTSDGSSLETRFRVRDALTLQYPAQLPSCQGADEPCDRRQRQGEQRAVRGSDLPDDQCERQQANAAPDSAEHVESGSLASASMALKAGALLLFLCVLVDHGGGCGRNRGKGEEESPKLGAIVIRNQPCNHGHGSAEQKADTVFEPA